MMAESAGPPPGLTRRQWRERQAADASEQSTVSQLFESPAAPSPSPSPSPQPVSVPTVLMVCTGNICRSPLAEVLLRARAGDSVRVHSAGTHALVDHEMTRQARALAVTHGARLQDAEAHRGRYLQEPVLDESTLIFTMTREQRTFAVQLLPRKMRRILTIREFARLAASVSDDELRAVAEAAGGTAEERMDALAVAISQQRGIAPLAEEPDADDVVDPYRKSEEVYEQSAQQLLPALDQVSRVVSIAVA